MATGQGWDAYTVPELREKAKDLGLTGFSRLRRDELIAALEAAQSPSESAVEWPSELDSLTVRELRKLASDQGVSGYSKLTRDELLGLLHQGGSSSGAPSSAAAEAKVNGRRGLPDPEFSFPESYGVDRVVLMARDADYLFAYWDVSGETYAELVRRGVTNPGNGWQRVLRLHDVTESGEIGSDTVVCDYPLDDLCREYYFAIPRQDRAYLVEYGYLSATGEFLCVARSNRIGVPRALPSDNMDEAWGTLYDQAFRLSLAGSAPVSSVSSAEAGQRLAAFLREGISSGHFSGSSAGSFVSGD